MAPKKHKHKPMTDRQLARWITTHQPQGAEIVAMLGLTPPPPEREPGDPARESVAALFALGHLRRAERAGWDHSDIASRVGVSRATLHDLGAGKTHITTVRVVRALATLADTPPPAEAEEAA